MAAGRIIFPGFMPCEDADGDRVAGAKAYVYLDLTDTLTEFFTASDLLTPLSNPVVADSVGVWPAMWADDGDLFTVSLTDGDGVPLSGATWAGVGPTVDAETAAVALAESAQVASETAQAAAEAAQAQTEAIAATLSGEPYTATSASSLTITAATKTVVLAQAGTLFSTSQTVAIGRDAPNAAYRMVGLVNGVAVDVDGRQTLTVAVSTASTPGSTGPFTDWNVSLAADGGVLSVAGETGVVTAAALKAALAIASTDIIDFNAAVDRRAIAFAVVL